MHLLGPVSLASHFISLAQVCVPYDASKVMPCILPAPFHRVGNTYTSSLVTTNHAPLSVPSCGYSYMYGEVCSGSCINAVGDANGTALPLRPFFSNGVSEGVLTALRRA